MKKKFKHLSLFSGCGGMDLGVHGGFFVNKNFIIQKSKNKETFIKLKKHNFDTVFANDIKLESQKFWARNFPAYSENFHLGSVVDLVKKHKLNKNIFPKNVDLLTGGFPCQDFSVSGLRKGLKSHKSDKNTYEIKNKNETRGMLYSWMKEVIDITNPKVFIAENVKGLINMEEIFEIIKNDFRNTGKGYYIYTRELYAPDYGIPQSRRRVFFIGVNIPFVETNKINFDENDLFPKPEFTKENSLFDNLDRYPKASHFFSNLKEPEKENIDLSQQFYSKAKFIPKHQGQTEVNENGIAPTIRSEHHGNIEFRYLKKTNGGKNNNIKDIERRLTVRECARIQTFPDDFEFVVNTHNIKISASAAYKLVGDAVPPLLAYKIVNQLMKKFSKYF